MSLDRKDIPVRITLFIILFLVIPWAAKANYYLPGSHYPDYGGTGGCYHREIYGNTVESVGMQWVAINNELTTMVCGQRCRNPAKLVSFNEKGMTFTIESLCTGAKYTVQVQYPPIELPANFGDQCLGT